MYVCICHAVTDTEIRATARDAGVHSLGELRRRTGCSGSCGQCAPLARAILRECREESADSGLPPLIATPAFA